MFNPTVQSTEMVETNTRQDRLICSKISLIKCIKYVFEHKYQSVEHISFNFSAPHLAKVNLEKKSKQTTNKTGFRPVS